MLERDLWFKSEGRIFRKRLTSGVPFMSSLTYKVSVFRWSVVRSVNSRGLRKCDLFVRCSDISLTVWLKCSDSNWALLREFTVVEPNPAMRASILSGMSGLYKLAPRMLGLILLGYSLVPAMVLRSWRLVVVALTFAICFFIATSRLLLSWRLALSRCMASLIWTEVVAMAICFMSVESLTTGMFGLDFAGDFCLL